MKYICTECNWTGNEKELGVDADPVLQIAVEEGCPICGEPVDVDDREPDELTGGK